MANYTITTTASEEIALSSVMGSAQDWLENAIQERARIAGDKIIENLISHCNANNIAIAVGRDAQITQANTLGLVPSAAAAPPAH